MNIPEYIDQLQGMSMNVRNGHRSPHKAVMMLAVIDLISSGDIQDNRICYDPDLLEHFRSYFDQVKTEEDSCSPTNPFFYLRSEDFWHHKAVASQEAVCEAIRSPGGAKQLSSVIDYAYLDDELFDMLKKKEIRSELREAIISRYFSDHYAELMRIVAEEEQSVDYRSVLENRVLGKVSETADVPEAVRNLAFARIVKRAYQHQCAACGLRLNFDGVSMVDAAHIIPYAKSHDDDPRNGMALCKNHHWAMDQKLIFPCSDNRWHILKAIDSRIDSHRALIEFDGKNILLPEQKKYHPKEQSLEWREDLRKAVER